MKSRKIQISDNKLSSVARSIRAKLVEISHDAQIAHLGSCFSCVDILVAAYWGFLKIDPKITNDPDRDRFILSKGHAAAALYTTLAYRGFISMDLLNTIGAPGSKLSEHPLPASLPGLELATGSLGHGLSVGLGIALAGRIKKQNYHIYVLMSDGECNEGSVWEAAMFAPAQKVNNLVAIIDYNKWQATGKSNEIMSLAPLRQKWKSFGWNAYEVDGHDIGSLISLLKNIPDRSGKPVAVIANTLKGKGVSFMEGDNNWHYRIPSKEEMISALTELRQL